MKAASSIKPRYKPGDAVWIGARDAVGHCRTPRYLRGKPAVIGEVLGVFRDPARLAYMKPGYPAQVLYKVRVRQHDLWPTYPGPSTDTLEADLYEEWLEARSTP
jgi:nitrile hydratase